MTEDQLDRLLAYIDARIDEKIEQAFGRDAGYEVMVRINAEDELRAAIREKRND